MMKHGNIALTFPETFFFTVEKTYADGGNKQTQALSGQRIEPGPFFCEAGVLTTFSLCCL